MLFVKKKYYYYLQVYDLMVIIGQFKNNWGMEFYKSINKIEQLSDISGEKRILIVEDDDIGLSLLEEIFIDLNYNYLEW